MQIDLIIGGISLPPVILALVELFKRFGLPKNLAPYATGALTILGYAIVNYLIQNPTLEPYGTHLVFMLVLFLTSSGLYDRVQPVIKLVTGASK